MEEFKQIEQVIQELEHTIKKIKLDHEKEVSHLLEQNRQLLQVQQTVVQDVQRQQHQLVAAATAAATAKSATTTTDSAQVQQSSMPIAPSNLGMEVEQPSNSAEKADVEMSAPTGSLTTAEKSAESTTNTAINATDSNANDDNNSTMTTDTNDNNTISSDTNTSINEVKKESDNDCNTAYLSNSTTNNGSNATTATTAFVTNSDHNSIDFSIKLEYVMTHNSVVSCVKFSPDGRFLATGSKKMVQLFSANTGEKVSIYTVDYDSSTGVNTGRVYDPPSDYPPSPQSSVLGSDDPHASSSSAQASRNDPYIRSVCFSPDNRLLGTGSEDKYIRFWSIPEKRLLRTWNGFDVIYSLEFTHDGTKLVSASGDNKARIWDSETGTLLHTLESSPSSMGSSLNAHSTEGCARDGLTSVAISPDGRYIATGSLDRVVRLWDAETSLLAGSFEGHTDSVYSVAFSPDGKTLASGSLDKTIKLWDVAAGGGHGCRATLTGHQNFVLSVAYSPDGKWIVSGSKDRTVRFWDAQSYKSCKTLPGHKNSVISVAISPNDGLFATGSGDSKARLWSYSVVKV